MTGLLYDAVWNLGSPAARWWLARHPRHHPLAARFSPEAPPGCAGGLWVQACSVGEVGVALPLLRGIADRFPSHPRLLTTSTVKGREQAVARAGDTPVTWFPFDRPATVRRFFDEIQPKMLVLVETELWPNVIAAARERRVPVLVANGRISDATLAHYRRHRAIFRPVFAHLTAVAAQSALHGERFAALGVPEVRIHLAGNLKYDGVAASISTSVRGRLRADLGIPTDAPLLVFGSTRPGDEALASACWTTLREEVSNLRLLIAPRHVDRLTEILSLFSEPVLARSEQQAGRAPRGERVLVLDTVGELVAAYANATAAVIGGSFYPGVDGHNPLEPAALGVPTVFGPHMNNFLEPARELKDARGAIQVPCAEDLYATLSGLLGNPAECRQMGTRARKVVLDGQGAVARHVDLVAELLGRDSG